MQLGGLFLRKQANKIYAPCRPIFLCVCECVCVCVCVFFDYVKIQKKRVLCVVTLSKVAANPFKHVKTIGNFYVAKEWTQTNVKKKRIRRYVADDHVPENCQQS